MTNLEIDNVIFALDSTTISTSIKLANWQKENIQEELLKRTHYWICEDVYLFRLCVQR